MATVTGLKGTGFSSVTGKQALEAFQDAKPNAAGKEAGQGEGGRGPEMAKGSSRDSDIRGRTGRKR